MKPCSDLRLLTGSSNVLEVQGVQNTVTGDYDTSATIRVTLTSLDDVEVPGQPWPVTLGYDPSAPNPGTYRATLEPTLQLAVGQQYRAKILLSGSGGETGYKEPICEARVDRD